MSRGFYSSVVVMTIKKNEGQRNNNIKMWAHNNDGILDAFYFPFAQLVDLSFVRAGREAPVSLFLIQTPSPSPAQYFLATRSLAATPPPCLTQTRAFPLLHFDSRCTIFFFVLFYLVKPTIINTKHLKLFLCLCQTLQKYNFKVYLRKYCLWQ